MESIRRRREAIFGHMARMSPNIPAHQALRLQVEASVGRRPDRDWVRSSGHPAWSYWSDATVLDDYAMTTTTTTSYSDTIAKVLQGTANSHKAAVYNVVQEVAYRLHVARSCPVFKGCLE